MSTYITTVLSSKLEMVSPPRRSQVKDLRRRFRRFRRHRRRPSRRRLVTTPKWPRTSLDRRERDPGIVVASQFLLFLYLYLPYLIVVSVAIQSSLLSVCSLGSYDSALSSFSLPRSYQFSLLPQCHIVVRRPRRRIVVRLRCCLVVVRRPRRPLVVRRRCHSAVRLPSVFVHPAPAPLNLSRLPPLSESNTCAGKRRWRWVKGSRPCSATPPPSSVRAGISTKAITKADSATTPPCRPRAWARALTSTWIGQFPRSLSFSALSCIVIFQWQ